MVHNRTYSFLEIQTLPDSRHEDPESCAPFHFIVRRNCKRFFLPAAVLVKLVTVANIKICTCSRAGEYNDITFTSYKKLIFLFEGVHIFQSLDAMLQYISLPNFINLLKADKIHDFPAKRLLTFSPTILPSFHSPYLLKRALLCFY